MHSLWIAVVIVASLSGCGGPARTSYAQYPGAPPVFDRTAAAPDALALADKVIAAAGGAEAWARAKQIGWKQAVIRDGQTTASGAQVWDRWNARHWARVDQKEGAGVVVMYELYGDFASGYMEGKSGIRQLLPGVDRIDAVKMARKAWQRDATVTCLPFLLTEPGVKLELLGNVRDGETEYQDLKITFPTADTARAGLVVHAYVDPSNMIGRVELETTSGERFGYQLSDWTEVGGLKLAATRKNLGSEELIKLTDIKVTDEPDDSLFIPPVS